MRRRTQPVRGGREYPTGSRTAGRQPTDPPEHPDTGQTGVRRARATTAPIA
jgi:hypothetical protein